MRAAPPCLYVNPPIKHCGEISLPCLFLQQRCGGCRQPLCPVSWAVSRAVSRAGHGGVLGAGGAAPSPAG